MSASSAPILFDTHISPSRTTRAQADAFGISVLDLIEAHSHGWKHVPLGLNAPGQWDAAAALPPADREALRRKAERSMAKREERRLKDGRAKAKPWNGGWPRAPEVPFPGWDAEGGARPTPVLHAGVADPTKEDPEPCVTSVPQGTFSRARGNTGILFTFGSAGAHLASLSTSVCNVRCARFGECGIAELDGGSVAHDFASFVMEFVLKMRPVILRDYLRHDPVSALGMCAALRATLQPVMPAVHKRYPLRLGSAAQRKSITLDPSLYRHPSRVLFSFPAFSPPTHTTPTIALKRNSARSGARSL